MSSGRNRGFTVTELLIAVLIVSLSGLLITGGISLAVRSERTVSARCLMNVLMDEYEHAIRSLLQETTAVTHIPEAEGPVIESRATGLAGFLDDSDGTVKFHVVTLTEEGYVLTDSLLPLCVYRQQLLGENRIISTVSCSYQEEGSFTVELRLNLEEPELTDSDSFTVWPVYAMTE